MIVQLLAPHTHQPYPKTHCTVWLPVTVIPFSTVWACMVWIPCAEMYLAFWPSIRDIWKSKKHEHFKHTAQVLFDMSDEVQCGRAYLSALGSMGTLSLVRFQWGWGSGVLLPSSMHSGLRAKRASHHKCARMQCNRFRGLSLKNLKHCKIAYLYKKYCT